MAGPSRDQRRAIPSPGVVREVIEDDGVPDLYADEFWLTSSPVSSVLTLLVAMPPDPNNAAPKPKARIVGRVRMSPQLAAELARLIGNQITTNVTQQTTDSGQKH